MTDLASVSWHDYDAREDVLEAVPGKWEPVFRPELPYLRKSSSIAVGTGVWVVCGWPANSANPLITAMTASAPINVHSIMKAPDLFF